MVPFQQFMIKEHIKNLRNEIAEHKKSQDEDFAYLGTKVDQKKIRWTRKVDQKQEVLSCNLLKRTKTSLQEKWLID